MSTQLKKSFVITEKLIGRYVMSAVGNITTTEVLAKFKC